MKRLIVTILFLIFALSLTGCTIVSHHHRHERHAALVSYPRRLPIRPPRAPRHNVQHRIVSRDQTRFRHMLP